jgi:hypothetical protein
MVFPGFDMGNLFYVYAVVLGSESGAKGHSFAAYRFLAIIFILISAH